MCGGLSRFKKIYKKNDIRKRNDKFNSFDVIHKCTLF